MALSVTGKYDIPILLETFLHPSFLFLRSHLASYSYPLLTEAIQPYDSMTNTTRSDPDQAVCLLGCFLASATDK